MQGEGRTGGSGDERLFASPRNAVSSPPGKDRKGGYSPRAPVLVRLVWPTYTEVVPAVLMWASRDHDRCLIEWSPSGRGDQLTTRKVWVLRADVKRRLRW